MSDLYSQLNHAQRRATSIALITSGKPFFCVYNPESDKPITLAFATADEAYNLADLMARKNPDECFFVMQAIGMSQTEQPVVRRALVDTIETKPAPRVRKK